MATPRRIRRANFADPIVKPNTKHYKPAYPETINVNIVDPNQSTLSRRSSGTAMSIIDTYNAGFDQRSTTPETALTQNEPARPTSVTMSELSSRLNRLLKDSPEPATRILVPDAKYESMDEAEANRIRLLAAQYRASTALPADFLPEKRVSDLVERRTSIDDRAVKFAGDAKKVVNTHQRESALYIPRRVVNPTHEGSNPVSIAVPPAVAAPADDSPPPPPPRRQYYMPGAVPLLDDSDRTVEDSVSEPTMSEYQPSLWTEMEAPDIPARELKEELRASNKSHQGARTPPQRGDSIQPAPQRPDQRGANGKSFFDHILHNSESTESSLRNVDAVVPSTRSTTINMDDSEAPQKKKKSKKRGRQRKSLRRRLFGSVSPLTLCLIIFLVLNILIIDAIVVFVYVKILPDLNAAQAKFDETVKKINLPSIPSPEVKPPRIVAPGVN